MVKDLYHIFIIHQIELAESTNSQSASGVVYSISGKLLSAGGTHQLRMQNHSGLLFPYQWNSIFLCRTKLGKP